ncbi:hypothetical protein BDV98DRAFT_587429 [Pterulicium gracile]|uniref:37S ribosomal protein mrp10, mitochondrial n=1 Tax=Pterulicium gracile TaxID=1884261 RepID=A0A5C3QXZ5_9AGAR|nr:hypothetical protein BDV98DRAFT_587429 [Pterula gracilis]
MHIKQLKVRPTKNAVKNPCHPALVAMLGCWAAHGDVMSSGKCATAAEDLYQCMRTVPAGRRIPKPSINYQLAKLQKVLK